MYLEINYFESKDNQQRHSLCYNIDEINKLESIENLKKILISFLISKGVKEIEELVLLITVLINYKKIGEKIEIVTEKDNNIFFEIKDGYWSK